MSSSDSSWARGRGCASQLLLGFMMELTSSIQEEELTDGHTAPPLPMAHGFRCRYKEKGYGTDTQQG